MPFIPHTQENIDKMLSTLGANSIKDVFDEIPASLKINGFDNILAGMSEGEISRLMEEYAPKADQKCFIGAGAYEHHIPAAIWDIVGRGEFMTAYTPYQAEASQGTLQTIYEFQSMVAHLFSMDIANASMYDGATALGEAILMAIRAKRSKLTRVLMPTNVHPRYRETVKTIVHNHNIQIEDLPFDQKTGNIDMTALDAVNKEGLAALVIPQPNFFGTLEEVDALTNWAHANNAIAIGLVNPMSLGILKAPGNWGDNGADIACGEGQPFGAPLSAGGPYVGLLACKETYIRQLPGRVVGKSYDDEGNPGYILTLQAREQHIRRAKATSNICTNQGLIAAAAAIYMSIMGFEGIKRIGSVSHDNATQLKTKLAALEGVEVVFDGASFHEFVIRFNKPVEPIILAMKERGILAGHPIKSAYPELGESLLVCVTETKTEKDLDEYVASLTACLN